MSKITADGFSWGTLVAVGFGALQALFGAGNASSPMLPARASPASVRSAPDGRHVVFTAEDEDGPALYGISAEGGEPLRLAGLAADAGAPWAFSPDGGRVVYVARELYSVALDGSAPVRLSDPEHDGAVRDFAFGADGRVVYRAAPEGLHLGLFTADVTGELAGGASRELVAPNERGDVRGGYLVSALGAVVFRSTHEDGAEVRLYSVPLSGAVDVRLLDRARHGLEAVTLGPDGLAVVYRAFRESSRRADLCMVPIDGGLQPARLGRALVPGERILRHEIASDGQWVVYLVERGDGRNELRSARLDGSAAVELGGDTLSDFRIHPDGRSVLYTADRDLDERFDLYAAALDGQTPPRLVSAPLPEDGRVSWFDVGVDGRIVYQVRRTSAPLVSDLWRTSLAPGLGQARLLVDQEIEQPRLAADGEELVYRGAAGALYGLALDGGTPPTTLAPAGVEDFELGADRLVLFEREQAGARALYGARTGSGRAAVRLFPPASSSAPRTAKPGGGRQNSSAGGVGFRDFSFGLTGSSTPTGEKPECKLWWNDGSWWGSLYNDTATDYHIYRLDFASQTWIDTGTVLDDRNSSKSDVLWDDPAQKLYVASHIFSTNAQPTASNWGRLLRYSYNSGTRTYTLDAGFPVDITRGNAEALTIAKDSTGRLWATWVEAATVKMNHSLGSDSTWGAPFTLPVAPNTVALTSDDISAIIAFGGNIGVMWSNQLTATTYFGVHRDVDPDNVWTTEIVEPDSTCTGACSDDLFSLKADGKGRVYSVHKTSLTAPTDPLEIVSVREPAQGWSGTVFSLVQDHHTRPILLFDERNEDVYVFATSPEDSGVIYYKQAPTAALQFPPGLGTPFIQNPVDIAINNATSTKQNLNDQTDLVVLASDHDTHFYLHNFIELAGTAPKAPTITSFAPTSGPVGTLVTINGANFTGATSVRFNGTAATFNVVSPTRIDTAVPTGATTGKISVTTANGTGQSAGDFTVTGGAPTITAFAPTSGPVGTVVAITGTNFTGATAVRFNGVSAQFGVASATRINAAVPSGATTGKISVTTPSGTATSLGDFTVTAPVPTITSFAPASGPVGTQVTVNGTNLSGTTGVRFNGTTATFQILSATQLRATVPIGATTGRITAISAAGTATSPTDFVVTLPPPTISSLVPSSGPIGTSVTVFGTNFAGTTAVRFNGTSAPFSIVSNTQINTSVPAGATTGRVTVTTPGGTATSPGDFTVTGTGPTITSFAPTSGPIGTAVSVSGTGFTGATAVRFNGIAATFTVVSATQINTSVPTGATTGKISVVTPAGTATSVGDFTVTPPAPTITSFAPTSGPVGTAVTVSGTRFTGATAVRFNGTAATFTVVSPTQINTSVPTGATTGKISVTTAGGTATSVGDFTVTAPAPTITSFAPTSGPVGTAVTVTGTNFTGATAVRFNGTIATITAVSATQINTSVPTGATSGKVSVTTPGGTATSAGDFTVTSPAPTITSFAPTSGPVGTAVTVNGTNFTGATAVRFNGTIATFTVVSATQINTSVSTGATSGKISVTTAGGTATSAGDFTVLPPSPTITSFAPTSGPVGTAVTVSGTSFTGATSVRFNGTAATFTVISATQINTSVPTGATSGKISVTTSGGTATSVGDFTVTLPAPTITSFAPTSGPVGTAVTVSGTSFTGATSVRFNGTAATFAVISATQINTSVPTGATSGKISVTTSGGTAASVGDFTVTLPAPTITSFAPTSGPVGTAVTVSGTSFTGATSVRFNGTAATFAVISATQINTSVPTGATSGKISVTTSGGTATSVGDFTVTLPAPTITSFAPTSGPVGTAVTVSGINFAGASAVRFNGTAATFSVISATQINTSVPTGATSGKISVTTSGGTATSAGDFTVLPPSPTITSFAPTSGPVGTAVTVSGTSFTGATSVRFNGTAATFTVISATQINTSVPTGATSGKISVTTAGGTATSAGDFTVLPPAPAITSFAPTSGPVGTAVTVSGTSFTGATSVRFNGTAATFTVISATQINTSVPTGATTGRITLTTPGGTATSATNFTVTPPVPTITSFTPTSGPVGTAVTVSGTNFTGATSVRFNGTTTTFTVISATQINTSVPNGATTGRITVTTSGGTATSAANFTVTPSAPTITSFAPTSGPVGTAVTVSGTNFTGATSVRFNGTTATFTVISATQINTSAPNGATTGRITVTTPGGTATSAANFTVTPSAPTITSFAPTSGPVGTAVTVSGTNFTGATSVRFNGTAATFKVVSSTQVSTTVPGGATTGRITVTTPGGTATSATNFTVTPPVPTITSFAPTSGPIGTVVTVSGANLSGATSVRFNGTSAAFLVVSSTQVSTTVPVGAGTGRITVTTPGGTATSSTNFTVTASAPTITSFTPTIGPVGAAVTVNGANLSGATSVRFNGQTASFTVVSSTRIDTHVPAGATTGLITVTTSGGTGTSASAFVVAQTPTIALLTPPLGTVGTPVSITGTHFTGASRVAFNGKDASFAVVTDLEILATVPTGATTGRVTVTTPGGSATSRFDFTVLGLPIIGSFNPKNGPWGAVVNLLGQGFTGATEVTFAGTPAVFSVVSDDHILATVPPGAENGKISVVTPAGMAGSKESFGVGECTTDVAMELWPPNHKYFDIDLALLLGPTTTDIEITSITQDEPIEDEGNGVKDCDGVGVGGHIAHVRAERDGNGNGRVYVITYSAARGACTGYVTIQVPHDMGSSRAVDDGQLYLSEDGCRP